MGMSRTNKRRAEKSFAIHVGSVSLRATHGTASRANIPMGCLEMVNGA
jgi:hypothetical protein